MNPTALLLSSLTAYFSKNAEDRKRLRDIIDGRSAISLRLLDYFVTHYAKDKNISYWLPNSRKFAVYLDYKAQLKSFSKQMFDCFRRHQRISFVIDGGAAPEVIETTVGQLNLFRWALSNGVIDYIEQNIGAIEAHMAAAYKSSKRAGAAGAAAGTGGADAGQVVTEVLRAPCQIRFE